jgi:hypothetical protein
MTGRPVLRRNRAANGSSPAASLIVSVGVVVPSMVKRTIVTGL